MVSSLGEGGSFAVTIWRISATSRKTNSACVPRRRGDMVIGRARWFRPPIGAVLSAQLSIRSGDIGDAVLLMAERWHARGVARKIFQSRCAKPAFSGRLQGGESVMSALKARIYHLYEGESETAYRFRYGILIFDIVTILYLIGSSFFYGLDIIEYIDALFGILVLADFGCRFWIAEKKRLFLLNPLNIADLIATLSFLAPLVGENFAFLRVLRVLRFLRSYNLLARLRRDFHFFRKYEELIVSAVHMAVFVFLMTEIVFVTQVSINPQVRNFLDAMYFTVTTLTTTGFGDITLVGPLGRLLSVVIMICGVSLFLKLLKSIFRPAKIRYECPDCGLFYHENDAVHCKHCGRVLNIPSDGDA